MRRDRVTPEMAQAVFARDSYACVAPVIDPTAGRCSGRLTIEHVKAEPRMGKRAESDDRGRMASVCEGHTEPGMKAGRVWNTAHRDELRRYLESLETAVPGYEP